jgi:DNA-directed RNA polymerase specialized sigma24 family protein
MPVYEHYSDEQLAAAARNEDVEAWEALIRRHGQRLLAFYTRMSGDEPLARELWVQAWSELWKLRGTLAGGGKVATSLFSLAARTAVRVVVSGNFRPPQGDPSSLEVRSERLRQALVAVPPRSRAALCLCYLDSLPFEEAGRCLGCGPGEAKQLCADGYAALAQHLGPGFLDAGLS